MAAPAKINFKVYQGSTFGEVLRWESSNKIYTPITNITKAAPVVITAAAIGAPIGWRVKITNVLGMTDINSEDVYHQISAVDSTTVTINSLNTVGYKAYTSGGIIEYNEPIDLASYTARMQIRLKVADVDFIDELTTENGGITIDNTLKTITLNRTAGQTAVYTFNTAVYSLEMVGGTQVTPLASGTLTLVKEVTR